MKSYPGLPTSGYFIQTKYHVMYTSLCNMDLRATVVAENNRITLSKESAMKTLSNLARRCIPFIYKNVQKNFN